MAGRSKAAAGDFMLFPTWQGEVVLPALPMRLVEISGNKVRQRVFPGATAGAKLFVSDIDGHHLIELDLPAPYDRLYLRRKNALRDDRATPSVTCELEGDTTGWPGTISVSWDRIGALDTYAATPDAVLTAWRGRFDFREEDEDAGESGLRTPQIGALHAIAAHFAVGQTFEPATVVLPTGAGKTETMLATQIYRRLERTLILVPSETLRKQIAGKFLTLGVLPDAKVVPREIARPRVAMITTGIRTADDARQLLEQANVIVTLPNTLQASSGEAIKVLTDGCSDLVVDEAHHITADTWNAVRERFKAKRIIQFTATPFRRDTQRIDGKIIFNYKLGDAQAAGYYRPITLVSVEEYGDDEARDAAIAVAAIKALRRDRDILGLDHLLMARTRTKDRAESVAAKYRELAPDLKPVVVYSGTGRTAANQQALDAVLDRGPEGARIVVCVDMLGEGFDLPNLKIAAFHDNHKSLAITLQFIGRFTRKGERGQIGDATVVVNVADPDAEHKLSQLYAEVPTGTSLSDASAKTASARSSASRSWCSD
jgi:superfamily II DNA or RNA helicase